MDRFIHQKHTKVVSFLLNNKLEKFDFFRDYDFQEARKALDAQLKQSTATGRMKLPKQSHSLSFEDEERL